ncbi:MAG: alpha/beta fold hydrolase [Rhizobiales bacterium]|nr:alpha/beta fold hydrolase [Hyphomicrobiales bacterium]
MFAVLTMLAALVSISPPRVLAASDSQLATNGGDYVVVLHGLGRSKMAMWPLALRLRRAGYRAELISYSSLRDTRDEMLKDIARQVAACCLGKSGKVHFVGHSLGGVMVRAYLAKHDVPNLGRVVLLGTPNGGSGMIDHLKDAWWFGLLGPVARDLGTGADSYPRSIGPPDYPVGIIAGKFPLIPNERMLPGDDDGLVSVAETKIEGMSDFLVIETRHVGLRYSVEAARQVVRFLDTASFDHTPRVRAAGIRISR